MLSQVEAGEHDMKLKKEYQHPFLKGLLLLLAVFLSYQIYMLFFDSPQIYSLQKSIPHSYAECLHFNGSAIPSSLECEYEVGSSYAECRYFNDSTIPCKYRVGSRLSDYECQKIGGYVFDGKPPWCGLTFYNPDYIFPESFEECEKGKLGVIRRIRGVIEPKEPAVYSEYTECEIYIHVDSAYDEDIAEKLFEECLKLGGRSFGVKSCGLEFRGNYRVGSGF